MKWLRTLAVPILIGFILVASLTAVTIASLLDLRSQQVIITARPDVVGPPSGFTVTRISDTEVELTWTKGHKATHTLIIVKLGEYPQDRDDGYQLYYGTGTTATDTAINLDEMAHNVYYRAWSFNDSEWSGNYVEGNVGGAWVTLIAEIIVVGLIMALAFWRRHPFLYILAAGTSIAFGLAWYDSYGTPAGLITTIAIIFVGVYCLFRAGTALFRR